MPEEIGFVFAGRRVGLGKFNATYASEFRRVLSTYLIGGAENILEWGSGLTTQILAAHAQNLPAVKLLLTIDDKAEYQQAIFAQRARPPFLREIALDLTGPRNSDRDPEFAYSTYPLSLGCKFDFIFIDGRRRMECAFIASLLCHQRTVVAIHDYRRTRYQPILALFDVVEDGTEFRVLRLRPSVMTALGEGTARVGAGLSTPVRDC